MRLLKIFQSVINNMYNYIVIKRKRIICGENVRINGKILYRGGKGNLFLGNNITINSDEYSIPIGYSSRSTFWTIGEGKIKIGDNSGLSNVSICSMKSVVIGEHVLLGAGVKIYDTDFHSLDYQSRRDVDGDTDRRTAPVTIENDVFIGAGTIVLKGVTIGERSIIGAGSVVRKNVPANEVWAGNPATFVKKCK